MSPNTPSGRHVLLVEDNRASQTVAQIFIKKLGHTADVAVNGAEAVAAAARTAYDLILMDCQMPVMDGHEATRVIRAVQGTERHTPIIAMTAETSSEESAKGLAAGMDAWLEKPLTLDKLSTLFLRYTAVDQDTLNQLSRQLEDPALMQEAITQYLTDLPPHVTALRDGVLRDDIAVIKSEAHALRGSSSLFNASHVMTLCTQLEKLAGHQTPDEAAGMMNLLEKEVAAVCAALSAENRRAA
jgi:two-component system sensor histidine kinase/response regulator